MGDGEIAVEVVLASKKFDKQYEKLQARLKNQKIDLTVKAQNLDNLIDDLAKVQRELDKTIAKKEALNKTLASKQAQFNAIEQKSKYGSISTEDWNTREGLYSDISKITAEQDVLNAEIERYQNTLTKIEGKLNRAEASYQKQKNNVEETEKAIENLAIAEQEYSQQIAKATAEQEKAQKTAQLDQINQSIKNASNSTEGLLKKVARWGLAVFGVRSAYMFVRQAINTLSQYNEQLGADIQYIRFALASSLQPIIETIINLVYKLLAYINYIAQAWFGVNIFANATVKTFKKVSAGVKDTNKSAKQLQKTLAGFDEMNILQKDGSTSTGGGGGGIPTPSNDLSSIKDVEIPEWIKWIAENKDSILDSLKKIAIAFVAIFTGVKILDFVGALQKMSDVLGGISTLATFGVIAGFGITLYGIIDLIASLITGSITFESALKDVGLAIAGVGLAMVALNATNPFGWVSLIIGGITALAGILSDDTNEVKSLEQATKDLEQAQRNVNEAYQEYVNAGKTHLNAYNNYKKSQKELEKTAKELGISVDDLKTKGQELYEEIRQHPEKLDTLSDKDKKLYETYLNHLDAEARLKTATDKLTTSEEKLTEAQKNEIVQDLEQQRSIANSTGKFEKYRDAVIEAYEKGAISGEDATDRLTEALFKTDKESKQVFVDGIPGYIQDMFNTFQKSAGGFETQWRTATDDVKIYTDSLAGKFDSKFGKDIPNSVQKSVNKLQSFTNILNKLPFGKTLSMKINTSINGSGNAKGAIYYPPKLAVGGIINQPGRGVPLAMGGERGAEGVIPLTDSQQMQKLGEAIGKYITVNANIVNTMNGRVISRELKQIENDENFAFNGG